MDHIHDRTVEIDYSKSSSNEVSKASPIQSQMAQLAPPPLQFQKQNREKSEAESETQETSSQLQTANGEAPETPNDINNTKSNNTGLPTQLKSGIENLSGFSLDDVNVHYNSDKPAQLQAHAYAQGSDIHLGPGQEKHLPHEAWHVVQQKQGRVQPTLQMKAFNINDDAGLEKEADVMGAKAVQMKTKENESLLHIQMKPLINNCDQPIQGNFTEIWSFLSDLGIVVSLEVLTLLATRGLQEVISFVSNCNKKGIDPQAALLVEARESHQPDDSQAPSGDLSLDKAEEESEEVVVGESEVDAALPGDCLYTAVLGNGEGGEDALRAIGTQWLLQLGGHHEIDDYGDREEIVGVVSVRQAWTGDAGDLSAAVLAFSQNIEIQIITAENIYIFNEGNGVRIVTIYYADNHYTSEPRDVHLGEGKTIIKGAPSKKEAPRSEKLESDASEQIEEGPSSSEAPKKEKKSKKKKSSGRSAARRPKEDSGGKWSKVKKKKRRSGPKIPQATSPFNGINPLEAITAFEHNGAEERYGTHPAAGRIVAHLNSLGRGADSSFTQVRVDTQTNATGRLYFGDTGTLFWSSNISHVKGAVLSKVSIYWFDPASGWTKEQ